MYDIKSDIAKEIITFLYFFDENLIKKIPDKIISLITKKAADSDKNFEIIKDKPLKDQKMSKECAEIIIYLYLKYMNTN